MSPRRGPGDHPRSRGVYWNASTIEAQMAGSSPLARGLHRGRGEALRPGRIIPARAGFTWARRGTSSGTSDHPRSRGVYSADDMNEELAKGSSPLARGLRRAHP